MVARFADASLGKTAIREWGEGGGRVTGQEEQEGVSVSWPVVDQAWSLFLPRVTLVPRTTQIAYD